MVDRIPTSQRDVLGWVLETASLSEQSGEHLHSQGQQPLEIYLEHKHEDSPSKLNSWNAKLKTDFQEIQEERVGYGGRHQAPGPYLRIVDEFLPNHEEWSHLRQLLLEQYEAQEVNFT